MGLLGIPSYISLFAAGLALFLSVDKAFLVLVVCSPLTTIAVFNLSGTSVLIYHLVWLVVAVKFLLKLRGESERLNKLFVPFLAFTLCSISFSLFSAGTVVVNVDNVYSTVKPSFQQFTQWIYLFVAVSTTIMAEYLLRTGSLDAQRLYRALDVGLVIVLAAAFLQLILPADVVTSLFRNSVHATYLGSGARISSTFQEPSMLSLYLIPMTCIHLVRILRKPNVFSIVVVVLSLVVCVLNNSSAAFLSLIGSVLFILVAQCRLFGGGKISHVQILSVLGFLAVLGAVGLTGVFGDSIAHMADKMMGEGVSGVERGDSIELMWSVFLAHPFVGIGWGTARCATFFCWLAELGIIGASFAYVPVLIILKRLWANLHGGFAIMAYLVSAFLILIAVSSEVYYLSLWIVLGLAMYETDLGAPRASGRRRLSNAA